MAADTTPTIDKLQVEIEATARGTASTFKQLEDNLKSLQKALNAIDFGKIKAMQKVVNATTVKPNTSGMSKAESEVKASVEKIQRALSGLEAYANKSLGGDKSAFKSFERSSTSAQSQIDMLKKKLEQIGNVAAPTKAFEKVNKDIEETKAHLDSLKAREQEATDSGGRINLSREEWIALANEIVDTDAKLKEFNAEADRLVREGKDFYDPFKTYRDSIENAQGQLTNMQTQVNEAFANLGNVQPDTTGLDSFMTKLANELPAAISKIQQDFAGLGSYANAALNGDNSAFTSFERRVTSIQSAIDTARNKIAQLEGAGVSPDGLDAYMQALQTLQSQLSNTVSAVRRAYDEMEKAPAPEVSKETEKASASMKSLGVSRTDLEGVNKALGKIRDTLKGIAAHGPNMGKVFKNILKYGFGIRSLYVLFRRLRKAVIESFGELQNSGAFFETTRANIESLKASLTTLKFQFGAAFEPIFNAVAPALQTLVNYLITVMNVLSAFTAKLMGKSTYSKAVANMTALGGATGGAAKAQKELNKQLQGFDELNNLTTNKPGGGGGGGAGGDSSGAHYVEESVDSVLGDFGKQLADQIRAGDWEGVGQTISDKLSDAMESIKWDDIYAKARGFGKGLADFLNGLINPRLFGNVGITLANSLNTAFEFLNTFGTDFEWKNFGISLGEGITQFFRNADFGLYGDTVHTWISGILDAGIALIENTDWAEIGTKLGDFLENLQILDIAKKLETLALKIAEGIGEALLNLATQGPVGAITTGIVAVLGTIALAGKLSGLATTITSALGVELSKKTLTMTIGKMLIAVTEFELVSKITAEKLGISADELGFTDLAEEYKNFSEHPITYTIEGLADIVSFIKDDGFGKFADVLKEVFSPTGEFIKALKNLLGIEEDEGIITSPADYIRKKIEEYKENHGMWSSGSHSFGYDDDTYDKGGSASFKSPLDDAGDNVLTAWKNFSEKFGLSTGITGAVGKAILGKTGNAKTNPISKALETITKKFQLADKSQTTFYNNTQSGSKKSGETLEKSYGDASDSVVHAITGARVDSDNAWADIGNKAKQLSGQFKDGFATLPTDTEKTFKSGYSMGTSQFKELANWAIQKSNEVSNGFSGMPSDVSSKFGTAYTESTNKFANTGTWVQGVVDTIKNKLSAVPGNFKSTFEDARLNATARMVDFRTWFNNQKFEKDAKLNAITPKTSDIQSKWNEVKNIWKDVNASLDFTASGSNSFNINSMVDSVNSVIQKFNESISLAIGKMNANNKGKGMALSFTAARKLDRLAKGGVLDMATPIIAGEAGTEAIVPLQNNTEWLGKMADMMVGEMAKPQHLNIASSITATPMGGSSSSEIAEQNQLLREEVQLLRQIANKELIVSSREVFEANRAEANNYYNRTGNSPFLF